MLNNPLPYLPLSEAEHVPNIMVDGAPTTASVLTLSHWPGIPAPPGVAADLSAQMAFNYLDRPLPHAPAEAVTNTHFDQDGLVGVFALHAPEEAQAHRELLIDVAAAGDFATYRNRNAARASMSIWCYAAAERSPIQHKLAGTSYAGQCALLYQHTLPLLIPMATEPERFRELWAREDEHLTLSERAIADRVVTIEEDRELDLAVIRIPPDLGALPGHRFGNGGLRLEALHPMAVHNESERFRQLYVRGRSYRYLDRYETWVQYRSRPIVPRVDLRPLAERLTALEPGSIHWRADPPKTMTPELSHAGQSALSEATVIELLTQHLSSASPAWDPYRARPDAA